MTWQTPSPWHQAYWDNACEEWIGSEVPRSCECDASCLGLSLCARLDVQLLHLRGFLIFVRMVSCVLCVLHCLMAIGCL